MDQQATQNNKVDVLIYDEASSAPLAAEPKKQSTYIFPNFIAKSMSKASPKVQYESSMMGTFLILVSITLTWVYYVFFTQMSVLGKVFVAFNALAGYLMLSSMLVTTYQQYQQYLQAIELFKLTGNETIAQPLMDPKKIKKIRYTFAIIEIIIIGSLAWLFHFYYLLILLIHPIYMLATTNIFITNQKLKEMEKQNVQLPKE